MTQKKKKTERNRENGKSTFLCSGSIDCCNGFDTVGKYYCGNHKKGCCVGQVPGAGVGNDCSHCLYIDYRSSICTVF